MLAQTNASILTSSAALIPTTHTSHWRPTLTPPPPPPIPHDPGCVLARSLARPIEASRHGGRCRCLTHGPRCCARPHPHTSTPHTRFSRITGADQTTIGSSHRPVFSMRCAAAHTRQRHRRHTHAITVHPSRLRGYPVKQHKKVVAAKGPDTEASPPPSPPLALRPRPATPATLHRRPPSINFSHKQVRRSGHQSARQRCYLWWCTPRPAATTATHDNGNGNGNSARSDAQWMTLKHVSLIRIAPHSARSPARSTLGLFCASAHRSRHAAAAATAATAVATPPRSHTRIRHP